MAWLHKPCARVGQACVHTLATGGDDGMHMAATAIDSLDTLMLANVNYSDALPFVKKAKVDVNEKN